jgi:hypothetical protein
MTPPHMQLQVQVAVNAGKLLMVVAVAPGAHGVTVLGMHAEGVGTPRAAVVAAATAGLDCVVHMPNGGIFSIGTWSMMVAAGAPAITVGAEEAFRVAGATPKLQVIIAPDTTNGGIISTPF